MKVFAAVFVLLSTATAALAQPLARPTTAPPIAKEFRYIEHHDYHSRLYTPPAVLFPVARAKAFAVNAEQALSAVTSALRNADYEWYLELWDAPSKAKILERNLATGLTKQQWIAERQAESNSLRYTLIEWLLKGPYIILRYEVTRLKGDQIIDNQAVSLAFSSKEGPWKATLDLENDPVFRLHGSGQKEIRSIIRP